ncbi:MAG: biotin--[acetyl-CoA-carboxylase] ligase [Proteobacteria bacterium]|nr:biotin--[acetyl-CoA-carboxylase] ligase [Pseudomonadota bacterium]MBU4295926.1 biotin--[acetyl-CoA-carboxylase] ligase [Pseudomonadota bacterium]MCG2746134.1 biotin--[acetyl-CoA-carboxylase] ligase [Desulfobulbaceae bacterium]
MGINSYPPSSVVQDYITAHEIERRSRLLPQNRVQTVFRYGAIAGSRIHTYASLERGMDEARQLIDDHERQGRSFPSGLVILAEELTGGKGRFQRYWHAPKGGIWMTMVFVNNLLPEISRLLPLAAGIACCETVRQFGVPAQVKWVNDVHVQGRKVAGILMETLYGNRSGEEYILIGAGLNVNNGDFPPELENLAGSMADLCGRRLDLGLVATDLLAKFCWNIGLLYLQEELQLAEPDIVLPEKEQFLLNRWCALSDSFGRRVMFGYDVQQNPQYEAEVLGLEEDGGLRLRHLEDNVVVTEYGGEIVYLD